MRLLLAMALALTVACGGSRPINNLPLSWRGVDGSPSPSPAVAASLAAVPIAFALRDVRPDPTAVGTHEDLGMVVRTNHDVSQYCSNRIGAMLRSAGARLDEAPAAIVESDLLEYRVDEGGTFKGLVRLRVTVRHQGGVDWSKTYEGTSTRWGKSHNPENFNEALSNALYEATEHLVRDDEFARALMPDAPQHAGSPGY